MADENSPPDSPPPRPRRSSITSNTLTAIFGRNNGVAPQPGPINTNVAAGRRVSISSVGLSSTSPVQTSAFPFPRPRRGSVSTAGSDSIDENAVDDDDGPPRGQPNTPFTRRMSFGAQALLNARSGGSPGSNGRTPLSSTSYTTTTPGPLSPLSDQEAGRRRKQPSTQASTQSKPRTTSDYSSTRSAEGLNWSEQFRTRAESALHRSSFSTSPTAATPRSPTAVAHHERAKSFSDMPSPPTTAIPTSAPPPSAFKRKPDAVGERMLRGDFYLD